MRKERSSEYEGGFVPIAEGMLLEILAEGKMEKAGHKNLMRVFAAIAEKKKARSKKLDLYRIANCMADKPGIRRLTKTEIAALKLRVEQIAERAKKVGRVRKRPVSRKVLQAIAQGRLSPSECIVALFYASKRITQVKPLERLKEGERYSRFKYGEIQELTGIEKARVGEAVKKLEEKGFLQVLEAHQQNVNLYGLLFTDGWLISLFRKTVKAIKDTGKTLVNAIKTATPMRQKSRSAHNKTAGLIKENIKTPMEKKKDSSILDSLSELEGSSLPFSDSLLSLGKKILTAKENEIPQTA